MKSLCLFHHLKNWKYAIVFFLFAGINASHAISVYPLPSIYTNSSTFALTVNGVTVPVVSYYSDYDYATFSMSPGTTTIAVTNQTTITSYSISPKKLGLTGTVSGKTLTFTITNNQYLIVQINSSKRLIIAADPPETSVPPSSGTGIFNVLNSPYNADNTGATKTSAAIQSAINDASTYGTSVNGQGIVYLPAGVYLSGNIQLKKNVALYMQGGSVIRATSSPSDYTNDYYKASQGHNITWFISTAFGSTNMSIYGRGTVDANGNNLSAANYGINYLVPVGCTNFTVDGITFRDADAWGLVTARAANLGFYNMKMFNRLNLGEDDGIDVCESQNVIVSNSIGIALDDSYSTKTWATNTDISVNWPGSPQALTNVVFDNCLAWTICYAFKVGQGVDQPQSDITFSNCVAYDCAGALGIDHKYGTAPLTDVTFDTIDVESVSYNNAGHGAWAVFLVENGLGDGAGPISNLWVRNINVRAQGTTGGFIQGLSSFASINNITFENIYMPGSNTPATTLYQMVMTNTAFYNNVTILPVQTPDPLIIMSQPTSQTAYSPQTVQFTVSASGNPPLSYQWQKKTNGTFVNLTDGGRISGSLTSTLTISNAISSDGTNYLVTVSDAYHSTNSVSVTLTVVPPLGPATNITLSAVQANGNYWDTANTWSINGTVQSAGATTLAVQYNSGAGQSSAFHVLSGGGMRTLNVSSDNSFPGQALYVDGNGVYNGSVGELILKDLSPGAVYFQKLVMDGGQIVSFTDSNGSTIITGGEMNVISNTPIAGGSSTGGRSFTILSQLTGNGSIQYIGYANSSFQSTFTTSLTIGNANNTYTGTWNAQAATLVGAAPGALGTNNITVGTAGALQTTYDIFNPIGSLTLNGRMNLTQNDAFGKVTVNGVTLSPGTHSFAQLNSTYPANFPATWTAVNGASITAGSGSISILPPLPVMLTNILNGTALTLTWPAGSTLLQSTNLNGPWTTNNTASPLVVTPNTSQMFYRLKVP